MFLGGKAPRASRGMSHDIVTPQPPRTSLISHGCWMGSVVGALLEKAAKHHMPDLAFIKQKFRACQPLCTHTSLGSYTRLMCVNLTADSNSK